MNRLACGRFRRVQEAAGNVKAVPRLEIDFDLWGSRIGDAPLTPLVSEWKVDGGVVDLPLLRSRDLKYEHVVRVVVDVQAASVRRCDVNVHLHGMSEL